MYNPTVDCTSKRYEGGLATAMVISHTFPQLAGDKLVAFCFAHGLIVRHLHLAHQDLDGHHQARP